MARERSPEEAPLPVNLDRCGAQEDRVWGAVALGELHRDMCDGSGKNRTIPRTDRSDDEPFMRGGPCHCAHEPTLAAMSDGQSRRKAPRNQGTLLWFPVAPRSPPPPRRLHAPGPVPTSP